MSNHPTPLNTGTTYVPKKINLRNDKKKFEADKDSIKVKQAGSGSYKEEWTEKNISAYNKNRQFQNESIKSNELYYYSFSNTKISNDNLIVKNVEQ
jgi:hypothetical protein